MDSDKQSYHCGYVAIIGRPNVGKSTLLNHILGQKISITSRKPQTTRHRVLGIKTTNHVQSIYIDTPGLQDLQKSAITRIMNKTVTDAIADVDVILFMIDGLKWTKGDQQVLARLAKVKVPVLLVINKIDLLERKDSLLPYIDDFGRMEKFSDIIPVSAKSGLHVDELEKSIESLLPTAPALFPDDQITDRNERFLAAEMIREKLMRRLGQEIPYALTVEIEDFKQEKNIINISALIWVERDSQKSIVIGKQGEELKQVGIQARKDMEQMFGQKVFLRLWVKVKNKWSDDERALRHLGYTE